MNKLAPASELNIWIVYGTNTIDYPGMYVGCLFQNVKATDNFFVHEDLEMVRTWILYEAQLLGDGHLYRMERAPTDDPLILEVWI